MITITPRYGDVESWVALPGPLPKQGGAGRNIGHVHLRSLFYPDVHAFIDRRSCQHAIEPALDVRKSGDVLPLTLPAAGPADTGHIRDRIAPSKKVSISKPSVHNAIEAIALVGEAINGILQSGALRRVEPKVMTLAGLGPEIGHLPEQPL